MKTRFFVFKVIVLLFMAAIMFSCQTQNKGLHGHMRQFDLVKTDTSVPIRDMEQGKVEIDIQDEEVMHSTASDVGTLPPSVAEVLPENTASESLSLNRVQQIAASRILRSIHRQIAGHASLQLTAPDESAGLLQELVKDEQKELKEKKSGSRAIDLLRLILYLLVALLIITILGILFKGYLFTIAVLVLLILGVMYLMGAL